MLNKESARRYYGDLSHVMGAKEYTYSTGEARGMRGIDVQNGSGLSFTLLPDRCLDIDNCYVNGIPVSFGGPCGVSRFRDPFLSSFHGGLLTTCGLMNTGPAEGGYGLHGDISSAQAYDVGVRQGWEGDKYVIRVRGTVKKAALFGENLTLHREIITCHGENRITLQDEIVNNGFNTEEIMLLYHVNFGYPMISKDTTLTVDGVSAVARDADAEAGINECSRFEDPQPDYREQVFFYKGGNGKAVLENKALPLTATLTYDLPYLIEWKQMGEGAYVLGLEPATYPPMGRTDAKKNGALVAIAPGESIKYTWTVTFA